MFRLIQYFVEEFLVAKNNQLYIIYADYEDHTFDIKRVKKDTHYYTHHHYLHKMRDESDSYVHRLDLILQRHKLDVNAVIVNQHAALADAWLQEFCEDVTDWLYEKGHIERDILSEFDTNNKPIILVHEARYSNNDLMSKWIWGRT